MVQIIMIDKKESELLNYSGCDLKNKAIFSIPDFYNNFNLNMFLLKLMHDEPQLFDPDVVIGSVYGTFPGCIWNGGRGQGGSSSFNNILATIIPFIHQGVQIRFTFTNQSDKIKNVLNDWYANQICDIANQATDSINWHNTEYPMVTPIAANINRPELAKYLSFKHPEFQLVNSTTICSNLIDDVNEMSKDRLTVLNYTMNNTNAIPELKYPENIEVLVCEACIDNCPTRAHHYETISDGQMYMQSEEFKCPHNCEQFLYYETVTKRHHHITPEMIKKDYIPIGINQFKISGRNNNVINTIESYAIYFSAEGQRDNLRNRLLLANFGR